MARPAGVKNQDYDEKRKALLKSMTEFIQQNDVIDPSLRQLSIGAGVSDVTLRHYFNDRQGVIVALFQSVSEANSAIREAFRQPASSLEKAVNNVTEIWGRISKNASYMRWHVFAIREAIADPVVFDAYEKHVIKPTSEALGEGLMRSSGGTMSFQSGRQAATHIIFNSMFLSLRELLRREDGDNSNYEARMSRFGGWFVHGMANAPDGSLAPDQKKGPQR